MTFKVTIPGRLAGTNEIIRDAAYNRYHGGAKRKAAKEHCYWAILEANTVLKVRFTQAVAVSFAWIEPNGKRDLDNITGGQKVIIDALVMAKVLPNDTRQWIKSLTHSFPEPSKANPRIEVTISDLSFGA